MWYSCTHYATRAHTCYSTLASITGAAAGFERIASIASISTVTLIPVAWPRITHTGLVLEYRASRNSSHQSEAFTMSASVMDDIILRCSASNISALFS